MAATKRDKRTGIPLTWMKFGKLLFELNGNATQAYRQTYPNAKGCDDDISWRAYVLKKKLMETGYFAELLEMAGLSTTALAAKLHKLANAKKKIFFARDGHVIEEREVDDNETQTKAAKLALEANKILVQRQEIEATISPATFTDWLQHDQEGEEKEEEEPNE